MMTEQDKQYAYGDWKVNGVSCPVSSAGLEDKQFADSVANEFDLTVGEQIEGEGGDGVIGLNDAKRAFETMAQMYERRLNVSREHYNTNKLKLGIVKEVINEEFNQ